MFYFLINKEILLLKSSKIQSQISMTKYIQVNDRLLPLTFSLLSTHADRQGVDISFTVCLCVFFVQIQISLSRIKLVVSQFAWWFVGVQGRESQIFVALLPQKPKIGRFGQHTGLAHPHVDITVEMRRRKFHARGALFMKFKHVCNILHGVCT